MNSKKTILIVEDSDEVLNCLKDAISDWDLVVAKDMKEASHKLNAGVTFDLIVTDYNFPGGNGSIVADMARKAGNKTVYLHSSDMDALNDNSKRYDIKFEKLDRKLINILQGN